MIRSGPLVVILCGIASLFVPSSGAVAERPGVAIFPQISRPSAPERDLSPQRPVTPSARGFVAPLTKRSDSSQAGIAGWTLPDVPVGSRAAADPERAGWFGFGFAVESGAPARRD